MFLLDTNVVAELRKIRAGKADPNVAAWADSVDALVAASATPEGAAASAALLADERHFIDHSRSPIFLTEEFPVLH